MNPYEEDLRQRQHPIAPSLWPYLLPLCATFDGRKFDPERSPLIAGGKVDLCVKDISHHHKHKGQSNTIACPIF